MKILEMLNKMYNKIFDIEDIEKIYYVGGNENLPAPLSLEEEEREILKLDKRR